MKNKNLGFIVGLFFIAFFGLCNKLQGLPAPLPLLPPPAPIAPIQTTIQITPQPTLQTPSPSTLQVPLPPTSQAPAPQSKPVLPGVAGMTAVQQPQNLVLVYTTEDQIRAALSECAAPTLPLFAKQPTEKSKFDIYAAIFKAISQILFQQISFDTKSKIYLGFVFDLIVPIIKSTDISLKNLTDAKDLMDLNTNFIKQTRDSIASLRTSEAEKLKNNFRDIDNTTQSRLVDLKSKIAVQEDFSKKLTEIQLATTSFDEKIKAFQLNVLPFFFKKEPLLKSLLDDFINSLGRLATIADTESQKKLFIKFTNSLLLEKMLSDLNKTKIKELIIVVEKAITQAITQATIQTTQATTTPQTTATPQTATPGVTAQAAPISAALTTPAGAGPAATPQAQQPQANPLQDLKTKLDAAGKDYNALIAACMNTLDLFLQGISSADKQSLAKILEEKVIYIFNARSSFIDAKSDILLDFSNFLIKAKNIAELKTIATDQKINTIKIAILLNQALLNKSDFAKISNSLKTVTQAMTKDIADYEKIRTKDAIDSLFSNRKIMKLHMILILKSLLDYLVDPTFKSKNVFSESIQSKFDSYSKIINATALLNQPPQSRDVNNQINYYKPVLNTLSLPDTDNEKKLLFKAIETIFAYRGNCMNDGLTSMKTFLESALAITGAFSVDQRDEIKVWLAELQYALSITSGKKLYIETLIENYINVQNFADNIDKYYNKIFSLFTIDTPKTIVNLFIQKLNELFLNRDKIDKNKLYKFFTTKKDVIDNTGINDINSLLGLPQKTVLKTWISALKEEIEGQKKATT